VEHFAREFIDEMNIPSLPERIPQRMEEAIRRRVMAFLYQLKLAKKQGYVEAVEIHLVRDAHRAVLTAYELGLADSQEYYASFRQLVAELGYERTEIGFRKES
jgi:hypothetical protein